ncbi:MAG: nitrite reductase small subunit NirD [Deltaproteobacteria bacterium]|nr:nitrite reductase small subunit NirD [Deltaproteobacteria bacterium]
MTPFEERVERRWSDGKTTWRSVDLGTVDSVPLGEGRAYTVNNLGIAVFRQRDGQLFATESTCPHRNGPLADGLVGDGKVICPLHAQKFDLTTGHCAGEDMAIRTYPVREVHGHIVVEIGPQTLA